MFSTRPPALFISSCDLSGKYVLRDNQNNVTNIHEPVKYINSECFQSKTQTAAVADSLFLCQLTA